jgi:enoyl-CoA hydratase/carnithine racemase
MSDITYSRVGGVGIITFNRPKANAYDLTFLQEVYEAIAEASSDASARVVVIESAVDRFFCAGVDIRAFGENDPGANKAMAEQARRNLTAIASCGKIYIAMIQGHALGGGFEIALGCDMRLGAAGDYQLGLPDVKLGLMPGNGGAQRLARMIGPARALELCITGRSFGPQEAFALGVLNRIIPAKVFKRKARAIAEELASGAPLAIAALKKGLQAGYELPLSEGLELEARLVDSLYNTEDAAESLRALTEKRAPIYHGR